MRIMRFLSPLVSLTLTLLPAVMAIPASPDSSSASPPLLASTDLAPRAPQEQSSGFLASGGTSPANAGQPVNPDSWFDPGAPAQLNKNCKGSAICSSTGGSCQNAAARFDPNLVYANYTSYVFVGTLLNKCTAIFKCDNESAYGAGMPGNYIRSAFRNLWYVDKTCKHCGSSYLVNGCHVTANYCDHCDDVGLDLALPVLGP